MSNKFNKKLITLFIFSLCNFSYANEVTDTKWKDLLLSQKFPPAEQAYCYSNERGEVVGENLDTRIRLASVSKLLTSLWALNKLGATFQYETKLFIKGNNLHIAGSVDPFFGNEKIFFLLSQLNDLGYKHFDTITFDKSIQINPNAQDYSDQYPLITRISNARNLKTYFNTQTWSELLKAQYAHISELSDGKIKPMVEFSIGEAKYVDKNPYQNDPEVKSLTLSSPALFQYLKEINVQSNNYAAQTIFFKLGGAPLFEKFLADYYNKTRDKIYFFTGSGLPEIRDGKRLDNYATCTTMIELMTELKYILEDQGHDLQDILGVAGSDGGTLSTRIFPVEYQNSILAKTGTLTSTSAFAGALSSKNGTRIYGIFNQSKDIEGSKNIQNEMVKSIMSQLGGPLAFEYTLKNFHTFSENLY
ncbi:MAG: D-alanyl-D-alanine carboxypeptidase [Bacteriovorax sp.]|nr:D-alanyl-D-alanine carboxypeptidase [Bacteriovorax sp.]